MKKTLSLFLALMMCTIFFLSACGEKESSSGTVQDESSKQSQSEEQGQEQNEGEDEKTQEFEKVTLTYWGPASGIVTDGVQQDTISKIIEEETGITLSLYANQDDAALTAMFASGDVPDLIDFSGMANETGVTSTNRLIENNRLMPMDELINEYAPEIKKREGYLEFCRDIYGNGTGELYVLQGYINPAPEKVTGGDKGLTLPFHYYAELGYPEINSMDDWLDVVKQMLEAHPETEEGDKRYGFSTFFEWGNLLAEFGDVISSIEGKSTVTGRTGLLELNLETYETRDYVSNTDSTLWKGTELFFKANQMGIMDPDIYINKWDTMIAKGDRILTQMFDWTYGEFNTIHAEEGLGYILIPTEGKYFVHGTDSPMGAAHRLNVIPVGSKQPEAAMRFLNYMFSEEGTRTLLCGVEGEHYIEKDGQLWIPKEVTDAKASDPNWAQNIGLGKYTGGLGGQVYDSKYNQRLDLGDPDYREDPIENTNFEQIYCDYYDLESTRDRAAYLEGYTIDGTMLALIESMPEDLADNAADINAYLEVEVPNLITAKDWNEFEQGRDRIIEECKRKGLDEIVAFQTKAVADAIVAAEKYK